VDEPRLEHFEAVDNDLVVAESEMPGGWDEVAAYAPGDSSETSWSPRPALRSAVHSDKVPGCATEHEDVGHEAVDIGEGIPSCRKCCYGDGA
jgi:hypothetical protein